MFEILVDMSKGALTKLYLLAVLLPFGHEPYCTVSDRVGPLRPAGGTVGPPFRRSSPVWGSYGVGGMAKPLNETWLTTLHTGRGLVLSRRCLLLS